MAVNCTGEIREAELHANHSIDTRTGIARLRVHGLIDAEGLTSSIAKMLSDRALPRDFSIMIVYERDALMGDVTLQELQKFQAGLAARQARASNPRRIRSALVHKREEQKVMLELHRLSFTGNETINERIFNNESEAAAWLTGAKEDLTG